MQPSQPATKGIEICVAGTWNRAAPEAPEGDRHLVKFIGQASRTLDRRPSMLSHKPGSVYLSRIM
jgi:hypothetical protein